MYTTAACITGFQRRWMKTGQGPLKSPKTEFLLLIHTLSILQSALTGCSTALFEHSEHAIHLQSHIAHDLLYCSIYCNLGQHV